jgi:rhamnulokinase
MLGEWRLAVDIGASGGRCILGRLESGRIRLEEAYRFDNGYYDKNGTLCWDIQGVFRHIVAGLRECGKLGLRPVSMGVDTWGVDFALLDGGGGLLGDTVAYRDNSFIGMDKLVEEFVPFDEMYRRTGIQKQVFNTVYQLTALKRSNPGLLERGERLLMTPDYLNYLLTDVMMNEYTIATTTGLLDAASGAWDMELVGRLGFPARIFGGLSMPGTAVGPLRRELREDIGFDCEVILPASHDTASAFLAIPARDDRAVYLSSGTWSLLGVESAAPVITEKGLAANFANEGGYGKRYRILKNIMGLWMLQSIRREAGNRYSYAELADMAKTREDFGVIIDVNSAAFLAPESMTAAITAACEARGKAPRDLADIVRCVYISLADCYAKAVRELEDVTGRSFTSMNIVGGGSRDAYLNGLTARAVGLPVYAGPTEGTGIGNLLAQMLAAGELSTVEEARQCVAKSFDIAHISAT